MQASAMALLAICFALNKFSEYRHPSGIIFLYYFLLFYAEDRNKLRHAMKKVGLEEVRFKFDYEGTKVILS